VVIMFSPVLVADTTKIGPLFKKERLDARSYMTGKLRS
jgi:hypothetical protein